MASVVSSGLALQPRLTTAAASELVSVRGIIDSTVLREGWDRRFIDSPSSPAFSSREAYCALAPVHPIDASATTAWALCLPAKLKIFSYLADIDRLSTRANLFFKNCASSAICAACPLEETGRHMFFDCCLAAAVWARLCVLTPDGDFSVWCMPPLSLFPPTFGGLALSPSYGPSGRLATTWCSTTSPRSPATFLLDAVMILRYGGGGSKLVTALP
jgi:hypothetical protein